MAEINELLTTARKRDIELEDLFSVLASFVDSYNDKPQENLRITLSMEFIMMKIRVLANRDLVQCKIAIQNNTGDRIPVEVIANLKKREAFLISINARLNEMRDDFDSIQKLAYTLNLKV